MADLVRTGRCLRRCSALLLLCGALACEARGSSQLEKSVEATLRSDPAFSHVSLVTTDRGIVTLAGRVDSDGDRAHLAYVVKRLAGVVAVDDRSVLVRSPPILAPATPDAELAANIVSRLRAAGLVGLDVTVNGKTIRVSGTIPRDRHADAMRIALDKLPRDFRVEDATVDAEREGM